MVNQSVDPQRIDRYVNLRYRYELRLVMVRLALTMTVNRSYLANVTLAPEQNTHRVRHPERCRRATGRILQ